MFRNQLFIFIAIGAFVLGLILVFAGILPGRKTGTPEKAALEFWSIQDDEEAWRDVIAEFQKQFPYLTVSYRRFDENSYEDLLINRLAEGKGPDIFILKNSWVAKHQDKIFPLPQEILRFSALDFQKIFVEAAYDDLVSVKNEILGLPLFIDTPALFYNKDIFNSSGLSQPPKTWEETIAASRRLTKKTQLGEISKPGLAFGTIANTEHFFEIINSLILQRGEAVIGKKTKEIGLGPKAAEAFDFYQSFSDPASSNFSWNARFPQSLDDFAQENSSMAFGFASDLKRLRAKNPHLAFGVSSFPQPEDARLKAVYADYFFPTVSKSSKNIEAAWQFVYFITSRNQAQKYLEKTGRPAARRDLVAGAPLIPELDAFWKQSLIAKSWPVPDEKAVKRVFQDAMESVITKSATSDQAAGKLREQLRLLLP